MIDRLNLADLGTRLEVVDHQLIEIIARRMVLGRQVEEFKRQKEEPIFRKVAETGRIAKAREWAEKYKIDPDFAHALIYSIMGETFKMEAIQLQDKAHHISDPESEEAWQKTLRENLLRLTARCAPTYDKKYDEAFFATHLHNGFESGEIVKIIHELPDKDLALDLGCANGRMTLQLAHHFRTVVGYDISPDMIKAAKDKTAGSANLTFEIGDIENGIPQPDDSVSFVVMNMGTASDICNIREVLREIKRVLKHEGIAFLSFYNRDALIYRWKFIPWPISLAAEINFQRHCLDVHWVEVEKEGEATHEEVYSVYAKVYRQEEIEGLLPPGLPIIELTTHPAITSILPDVLLEDETVRSSMVDIDSALSNKNFGAYITAVVRKS